MGFAMAATKLTLLPVHTPIEMLKILEGENRAE
jgi:hypothetical protein